jgi:hypothetical protein
MDNTLISVLEKYGTQGLVLLVAIYVLLNSKFTIQYPRGPKDKE